MAGNPFELDISGLIEGLEKLESDFADDVMAYGAQAAERLESYAKRNRKWKDRTTDARKRLKGTTERLPTACRIKLAHGVPYGVWLEFANEKRFAIIAPTIRVVGSQEIMPGLQNLMERK